MKILQINSVCGYGSTGRIATDIYKVLEEQGHECVIAYGRGNAPEGIKSIKIGTNFDNYIHVAKTRAFDKHGFSSDNATKKFIEIVEDYNPDIIHLHNIHGYYINVEILFNYLKEANKPVVWTLHDCWAFTGHCTYFDFVGCDRWKTGCYDCPQKKDYPTSLLFDKSQSNYRRKREIFLGVKNLTVVTPSKWLSNLVKESFLKKYNVKVINNGIDLDIFKWTASSFKEKKGIKEKFLVLGVASQWTSRKGLEEFIKLSTYLDQTYQIVLIGLNEDQKVRLPQNIISMYKTDNIKELVEIYSTADVFVNPTLEDNFPTTNLEALACGTPVITYRTGGSVESIDNSCGEVVDKENIEGLVRAIHNSKNIRFRKEDCLVRANLYDKKQKYREYIDLYEEYYCKLGVRDEETNSFF